MRKEFATHKLNASGLIAAKDLGDAFENLLNFVEEAGKGGDQRCLALVRTKLEEACFYAKKAMACDSGYQEGAL